MNKKRRPTLQDVADKVGVTKMTISRYLKDSKLVSPTTRKRVALVLEELDYIPNHAPRILSHAKSRVIGILIPSLTNQFVTEVVCGIEEVADKSGYQTMFAHYHYNSKIEEQKIASLLSYNIDGLILSESCHTPRTLRMIETARIPVVEMMDSASSCIHQCIGFNNEQAAQTMASTMIDIGYKRIVYLGSHMDIRSKLKKKGYDKAMISKGLKPIHMITNAISSLSLGAKLLNSVLQKHPDTDSFFCANDDIAVGVIFECQRLGILVPDQIGVAGFHGHNFGQLMLPKLASVITPQKEIGKVSVTELIHRLHDENMTQKIIDLGFKIELGHSLSAV